MYFVKRLQHEVLMHPETFGRNLKERIRKTLEEEVEGSVAGTAGIIVAVLRLHDEADVERGLIEYETGKASFIITYVVEARRGSPWPLGIRAHLTCRVTFHCWNRLLPRYATSSPGVGGGGGAAAGTRRLFSGRSRTRLWTPRLPTCTSTVSSPTQASTTSKFSSRNTCV